LPMSIDRYGAPYLCMHRAELHSALLSCVPPESVHLGKKLVGVDGSTLFFDDDTRIDADVVIGADGVHSLVRDILFGREQPIHRGRVAYRTVFPAELLRRDIGPSRTKWWGRDRQLDTSYTNDERAEP